MADTEPRTGRPPVDRPSLPHVMVEAVTNRAAAEPTARVQRRPPWAIALFGLALAGAVGLGLVLMPDHPDPTPAVGYHLRLELPSGAVVAGPVQPGDQVVPVVVAPASAEARPFAYLVARDAEGLIRRVWPAEGDARLAVAAGGGRVALPAVPVTGPAGGGLVALVLSDRALPTPTEALTRLGHARVQVVRRALPVEAAPAAALPGDAGAALR